MSNVSTVFAMSARKIANAVAPRANTGRLLRSVSLDRDALEDSSLRIPYADMMMLSELAARMTRDSAFGLHVGEAVDHKEYGVVGYSVTSSATLGQALRSLVRYLPIWTNVGTFRLDTEGSVAHFQWEYLDPSLPEPRHDCEMSMATVARFNRLTADSSWAPREVWFRHKKPRDTSEHSRIFRAPVRFGMQANAVLLDTALLDLPLKNAKSFSHSAITAIAEQLLARTPDVVGFSQSVLSFIRQRLSYGEFGVETLARHFGVSRRTYQRQLQQEGSSHRNLVQQARRELSRHLLLDAGMTATEAAHALGYAEHSVFHRAFQRWHGVPPGTFGRS